MSCIAVYTDPLNMPDDERRLFNFEPGSAAFNLRLVKVQADIRSAAAAFEQQLCETAGITPEALHKLLETDTIGDIHRAIKEHGHDFVAHLGQARVQKPEDPRAPGWLAQWEIKHDK